MPGTPLKPLGRPLTKAENELLEWFTPLVSANIAEALKPTIRALEDRLDVLESENISMRRALSTKGAGAGPRRPAAAGPRAQRGGQHGL